MSDPAIDHPGVRLDAHLSASIEDMKARDTPKAPITGPTFVPDAMGNPVAVDTKGDAATNPIVVPPPVSPIPDVIKQAAAETLATTGLAAVATAKPAAPKPKAPVNAVAMAIKAVASVNAKLTTRANRIVERAALAHIKVDDTFDKQEGALAATEDAMDMLDASLTAVGNEEGNA